MGRRRTNRLMHLLSRVVVAMIAVLLPAGALAATTVGQGMPGPRDGRAGATGFAAEGVADDEPVRTTIAPADVTTVAPPPPTVVPATSTTSVAPQRTTTTTRPLAGTTPGSTLATLVPGLPLPNLPPLPILEPPVSSWSSTTGTVSARMRMEPATPLPGQPVRFFIDVVAPGACCAMNLSYGDGVVSPNPSGNCDSPTSQSTTLTHTFTSPGDYELLLIATAFPCRATMVDGQFVPPPLHGTSIKACITVGIRLLAQPSCAPFNHFGPDKVVSSA